MSDFPNPENLPPPTGPPLSTPLSVPPFVSSADPQVDTITGEQHQDSRGRNIPRWGMGDIGLGVLVILGVALASLVGFMIVDSLSGADLSAEDYVAPVWFLAITGLFQQTAQFSWPLIVSKWKGLGPVKDWGLKFRWVDLFIGVGSGFGMMIGAALVTAIVASAVGLEDLDESSNTGFLEDASGSPWLPLLIFTVVVGAPLSEELFFRGLIMRSVQKRFGQGVGIVASTVVFTIPHYVGGGWQGTTVLFASLGFVGATLAALAARTGRLGSPIVAHATFNSLSVLALFLVEENQTAWIRWL